MSASPSTIKVGGDPEFFLARNGHFVCPPPEIKGTKEVPVALKGGGSVQRDGLSVEFNIKPASSGEEFQSNVLSALSDIRDILPRYYEFIFKPTVIFTPNYFKYHLPEGAKELGCSPDWNAYTGQQNPNPAEALRKLPTMRTGAGHLTIGWTEGVEKHDVMHELKGRMFVKNMDEFYFDLKPRIDGDHMRPMLYGARGAYRPTTFGVEYRVPSNAWVKYPHLYPYMFDLMKAVWEGTESGEFNLPKFDEDMISLEWSP